MKTNSPILQLLSKPDEWDFDVWSAVSQLLDMNRGQAKLLIMHVYSNKQLMLKTIKDKVNFLENEEIETISKNLYIWLNSLQKEDKTPKGTSNGN